ncbi:hypothetical protein [Streptomyces mesophilus]|uniref:hypothetical protein n=1 Tax=Streptomyces mesophilus TaxID=1775132 RepID=UPI00332E2418
MSELINTASQLVPYVTGFGGAVVLAAQNRAAESVVERGRLFLDRVVFRRGDDAGEPVPDSPARRELADALDALSDDDRALIAGAVGRWLESGARGAGALRAELGLPEPGGHHAVTYGPNSIAIGQNIGDIRMGRASDEDGTR